MAIVKPTNFGRATIASAPTGTTGTSLSVTAGQGALFPSLAAGEYFYGVFTNAARSTYEVVKVTARSGDGMTIVRAQDGTSAATWTTSDIFYLPQTRQAWAETSYAASSLAIGALTPAADLVPYFTSATAGATTAFTAAGRSLVGAATASAALAVLIPAGTVMIFQQTAAPTGWTKLTTNNDKALRVVSGTASTGGATAFTSVFGAGKSSASYTLQAADIPAHAHTFSGTTSGQSADHSHGGVRTISAGTHAVNGAADQHAILAGSTGGTSNDHTHTYSGTTSSIGSTGGHAHTLSLDLQYVDVIAASKD